MPKKQVQHPPNLSITDKNISLIDHKQHPTQNMHIKLNYLLNIFQAY